MHPSLYSSYREKFEENDKAKACHRLIDNFNYCIKAKNESESKDESNCMEIIDKYVAKCTVEHKEVVDKK